MRSVRCALRQKLLPVAILVLSTSGWAVAAPADDVVEFDIPPQALSQSLMEFSRQSDITLVANADMVRGKQSRGVQGAVASDEALRRLLAGSGLSFRYLPDDSITIIAQRDPGATSNGIEPSGTADPAPVEEVVVTGFRQSLDKALAVKRESTGVVDAIVAEDIAKFPDTNLAESIQRVPGVAITRERGEGRQISVRGLGAQFTRVRINGMEAQAASEGNSTRGFDFNIFASELFNRITVRKTSSADVDEGSLGATVDLQTARPLDYEGFTLATSAQGGYNDLSEAFNPRAAFLISNVFGDGSFGALFSAAYSRRTVDQVGDSSGVYYGGNFAGGFCDPDNVEGRCYGEPQPAGTTVAALNSPETYVPRFPRSIYQRTEQDRLGLTGSLQFSPSDRTELSLDLLYSDLDISRNEKYVQGLFYSDQPGIIVRDATLVGTDLVAGVMDNVDLRTEQTLDESTSRFTQLTLSGEQALTERLTLSGLFGYSQSNFDNPIETTVQMDAYDSPGYAFDARGGPGNLIVSYGADLDDPDTWYVGPTITMSDGSVVGPEIRIRPSWVDYSEKTGQLDLDFEWFDGFNVQGGLQYKRFTFDSYAERLLSEKVPSELPEGTSVADISTSFTGPDGVTWRLPSIDAFDDVYGIYSNSGAFELHGADSASARGQIRAVEEEDVGAYLMGRFNSLVGRMPFRGDFGVRYVRTSQWSDGFVQSGDSVERIDAERAYDNWLPSANLVLEPSENVLLRLSAAKVMSRASLSTLSPNTSISTGNGTTRVSRGNPKLDPIQATTFDLSFEWYPAAQTIVSVGLFYKDIDTYVQTLTLSDQTFEDTGLTEAELEGTGATVDDNYTISRPVNTSGGPLKGFEIGYQQPLGVLADWLDGFGVLLNYTFVDSEIDYLVSGNPDNVVTGPLLGLSKYGYNGTLYYEKNRWSLRVSGAHRSKYTRGIPGPSNQDIYGTDSTFNVDASASYELSETLSVSLEGINLTDEATSWYSDSSRRWQDYYRTGREILLGVRYRY